MNQLISGGAKSVMKEVAKKISDLRDAGSGVF